MMFDLNDMSRSDLAHLARCIEAMEEASDELERAFGAPPRFVMAPGRETKLILPPIFVGLPAEVSVVAFPGADARVEVKVFDDHRRFVEAEKNLVRDHLNSDPVPEPQEVPSKPGRADAWTELELSQVVEAGVEALMAGRALTSAAQPLADALGRTVAACQKQLKAARERIEERAAELTPRPADPEPAADPAPPPAAARVQHNLPTDDLQAHLNTHAATGGWTAADDLRLFDLSETGWPMHEVALEVGKSSDEVKRRFELLTDKKGRKFARADVLDRLRLMQPVEA